MVVVVVSVVVSVSVRVLVLVSVWVLVSVSVWVLVVVVVGVAVGVAVKYRWLEDAVVFGFANRHSDTKAEKKNPRNWLSTGRSRPGNRPAAKTRRESDEQA